MAETVDVLDTEIDTPMTVRDSIIYDAKRGCNVNVLFNRYSRYGVTFLDIQRALASSQLGEFFVIKNGSDCAESKASMARMLIMYLCGAIENVGVCFFKDGLMMSIRGRSLDCFDFVTRKKLDDDKTLVLVEVSSLKEKKVYPDQWICVNEASNYIQLYRRDSDTVLNFKFHMVSEDNLELNGLLMDVELEGNESVLWFKGSNRIRETPFELFFDDTLSEYWRRFLCACVKGMVPLKGGHVTEDEPVQKNFPLRVTIRCHRGRRVLVRQVLISELGYIDVTGFELSGWVCGVDIVLDMYVKRYKFAYSGFEIVGQGTTCGVLADCSDNGYWLHVGVDVTLDETKSGFNVYAEFGWIDYGCDGIEHRVPLFRRVFFPYSFDAKRFYKERKVFHTMRRSW